MISVSFLAQGVILEQPQAAAATPLTTSLLSAWRTLSPAYQQCQGLPRLPNIGRAVQCSPLHRVELGA